MLSEAVGDYDTDLEDSYESLQDEIERTERGVGGQTSPEELQTMKQELALIAACTDSR